MTMVRLYTEAAADDYSRSLGLMHRDQLGANSGMVFVFASPRRLSFWMKDTKIPLDIAYATEDLVISEIRPLAPYSTKAVMSNSEAVYAVEANSGFFNRTGIMPGSKLVIAQVGNEETAPLTPDQGMPEPAMEPAPDRQDQAPAPEPPPAKPVNPMPDLILNMSISDAMPMVNKYKLAIAFNYELPNGNHESYYMLPLERYQIVPGRNGRLICGPCSHSNGEFRNFKIDNILGYDLYETVGPRGGRRVALPVVQPPGKNAPDVL